MRRVHFLALIFAASTLFACVADVGPARAGVNAAPSSVDWRAKGMVGPVPDQGQCSSDWAFSAAGAVYSAVKIADSAAAKNLPPLSAQQLMDCSTSQGNEGCDGGLMNYAYEYMIANGGLTTQVRYPYTGQSGTCQSATKVAKIGGYKDVRVQDNQALMQAIAVGPVSAGVQADQPVFQFYSGGVIDDPSCGTQLDHAVLVVGYNALPTKAKDGTTTPYWLVQNFWGPNWGEGGYIRIAMSSDPAVSCGITMAASYPTGATLVR